MSARPEADQTVRELTEPMLRLDLVLEKKRFETRFESCIKLARLAHGEIMKKIERAANAQRDYQGRTDLAPELVERIVLDHESIRESAKIERAIENLVDAAEGVEALALELAEEFRGIAGKLRWSTRPRPPAKESP